MNAFFVFSGQGAQSVGMGRDLADNSAAAAEIFRTADAELGFALSDIIFNGPEEKLTQTKYCQVAIYTMSCAALAAFREKFPQVEPVACAGLSLGEYGALYAAGAFDFVTGLKLLAKRAELMDAACAAADGGMASVLNGDLEIIRKVCADCDIDVANYNSPSQIVISGVRSKVGEAVTQLKAQGIRKAIELNVAGAFHSRLMAEAGKELKCVLEKVDIAVPPVPVFHNFTAAPAADCAELKDNLAKQVAGSVRWDECVRNMVALGGDTMIEFGPGNVLTGLMHRTDGAIRLVNINNAESLKNFSL